MITLVLFTALLLLDVAAVCFLLGWACCARRMGRAEAPELVPAGHAVEKARIEARNKGHACSETRLEDGSIRVTVKVGDAVFANGSCVSA
jgi:hypothetical protein